MKFFMFGQNMLLRDENDGDGNDLGGADEGTTLGGAADEGTVDNSAEAIAAAAKADTTLGGTDDPKLDDDGNPIEDKSAEGDEPKLDDDGNPIEDKPADDIVAEGAPESYEAFELPTEYDGIINEESMEAFSQVAKDLDLSQVDAQKLVDFEVQRQMNLVEQYQAQAEQWKEDSKTDDEIGGADAELKQAKAAKAYDLLATDEFKSLMNPYHAVDNPKGLGLGNHPEMVRLFYRVGLKMSEDGLVMSDLGGTSKLAREDVMYPVQK